MRCLGWLCTAIGLLLAGDMVRGGEPSELLRGEAPVLFTGAEGEDANGTLLLDGQPIRGDEIWLWVPAVDGGTNQVDLLATGQFFRIWDSGVEAGPDGNDDDDNGMRAMDFDPVTGTFLISYEDTTTTGFAFGNILDGDLMELTVTSTLNGAIDGFQFTRLFSECASGGAGCIGTGDINGVMRAGDGTLYFGAGGSQAIVTDAAGTVATSSSSVIHASLNPDPQNIGSEVFFEPSLNGCPIIFCPGIYTGQLRGFDLLATGEITFGTSGDYRNQDPGGNGVVDVGFKADIMALPDFFTGAGTLEQRTAEVLYPGSLFFQTPNMGDSEILAHDVLDSAAEVSALIALLGASSPPGLALTPFAPPVGVQFVRGDCNADGSLNIADAVFTLNVLFPIGAPPIPDCDDACDANDDDSQNIADAVAILTALFGAPPVPLPAPLTCGVDPTDTDLFDCMTFVACP